MWLGLGVTPATAAQKTVNGITVETNLSHAVRGDWYSYQIEPTPAASYTFELLPGGNFPAGFSLSSSGSITGVTCDSNGTKKFNVRIRNGDVTADFTGSKNLSIQIVTGAS